MAITVTIAPCRADRLPGGRMRLPMQLLEIAQAMSDDCDGDPIRILDTNGHEAAVIGRREVEVELF
ncbi:hypothetical protein EI613_17925 [Azospirillum sp. 412522]|nr:hypothetical protein [Azospirillum sp. 412522]MBY6263779.1 hypothetical protein [Azospirillum sp. 412522]